MGLCFLSEKSRLFAFAVHFCRPFAFAVHFFQCFAVQKFSRLALQKVQFALCKSAALVAVQKCKSF